jgi:hypothetical protein
MHWAREWECSLANFRQHRSDWGFVCIEFQGGVFGLVCGNMAPYIVHLPRLWRHVRCLIIAMFLGIATIVATSAKRDILSDLDFFFASGVFFCRLVENLRPETRGT